MPPSTPSSSTKKRRRIKSPSPISSDSSAHFSDSSTDLTRELNRLGGPPLKPRPTSRPRTTPRHRSADAIACPHPHCAFATRYRIDMQRHVRNDHQRDWALPCDVCGKTSRDLGVCDHREKYTPSQDPEKLEAVKWDDKPIRALKLTGEKESNREKKESLGEMLAERLKAKKPATRKEELEEEEEPGWRRERHKEVPASPIKKQEAKRRKYFN